MIILPFNNNACFLYAFCSRSLKIKYFYLTSMKFTLIYSSNSNIMEVDFPFANQPVGATITSPSAKGDFEVFFFLCAFNRGGFQYLSTAPNRAVQPKFFYCCLCLTFLTRDTVVNIVTRCDSIQSGNSTGIGKFRHSRIICQFRTAL